MNFEYYHKLIATIKEKLVNQGERSAIYNEERRVNECFYRKDQTAECEIRCAAGHLISDENYHVSLEDRTVNDSLVIEALAKSGVLMDDEVVSQIILQAQICHDGEAVENWSYWFDDFAKKLKEIENSLDETSRDATGYVINMIKDFAFEWDAGDIIHEN